MHNIFSVLGIIKSTTVTGDSLYALVFMNPTIFRIGN